jgi:hypothetical protein
MSFRQVTKPHMKKSVVTIAIAAVLLDVGPAAEAETLTDLPTFVIAMVLRG